MADEKNIRDVKAKRDVIIGDQINITYQMQMKAYKPPAALSELRRDYLGFLRRTYRALDFKGIPQLENFAQELLLEEVYVPLLALPELPRGETWERRLAGRRFSEDDLPEGLFARLGEQASPPLPVEEALGETTRLIVLGDPGSGKTTLLKYLTLRLAAEDQGALPILAPLNAYAAALNRADANLQAYLPNYFAGLTQGIANLGPLFDSAIAQGQAVILLDGLDEVQSGRSRLVHKVEAFAAEAVERGNKLLVTSRIVGYRESPLNPRHWKLYTLLDFNQEAIQDFAHKWCLAFERSTRGDTPEAEVAAQVERDQLLAAIRANPGVTNLASNPLLLTILALIKRQGVSLPNRRVELYELYLKTLISTWSKARALDGQQVGPELDYYEILMTLAGLALWLRQENPTAGVVPEQAMLGWLVNYYMGDEWGLARGPARQRSSGFLQSVRRYSNLVLERGQGQYGFIHLTFEEMLAAYGLYYRSQLKLDDSLAIIERHLEDPGWRETILLAVGVWGLVNKQPLVAGEVLRAMLKMPCSAENACRNVLLAGACLEDVGEMGVGRAASREVIRALQAVAFDRGLPPKAQQQAGLQLGCCGWAPEDLDAWVSIPAGSFQYGDDKGAEHIRGAYAIGKYPVTNQQYRRFVQAGGYDQRDFWSETGWAWLCGEYDSRAPEELQDWLARRPPEKRWAPFYWGDSRWNNPLAPVVGVCWFEAQAYCNWLAQEIGKPVRLPDEVEWERAARSTDGRQYPWGDDFDPRRLNCAEFWSGREDLSDYEQWEEWFGSDSFQQAGTTMVGQFPAGASLEGALDMSGNVWEWTGSWYDEAQIYRVFRGGSWNLDRVIARCASRYRDAPDGFNDNLGFRVVSPGSVSGS